MTAATENLPTDFDIARHDMLNVLQALKLQYDLAMEAAEKCESLDVAYHVECLTCIDRALAAARIMEELAKRYTRLLGDMRALAVGKNVADVAGKSE